MKCSTYQAPWRVLALCVAAAIALASCQHAEFVTDRPPGVRHNQNNPFFLWGLVGDNEFDVAQYCPQGVSRLSSYESAGDWFLFLITLGIYSPRSVEITCAQASAKIPARFELAVNGDGHVLAVRQLNATDKMAVLGGKTYVASHLGGF